MKINRTVLGFIIGLCLGGAISQIFFTLLSDYHTNWNDSKADSSNTIQAQQARNTMKYAGPFLELSMFFGVAGAITGYYLESKKKK